MAPANYLQYVVETAYDWGASNQLGMDESERLGLAWVIRETELEILKPLTFGDDFDLTIWLMEWRRVRGVRGFKLIDFDNGDIIAHGTQKVVCIDMNTMRPISPPDQFMDSFRLDNPPAIRRQGMSIIDDRGGVVNRVQRNVDWRDLDSLNMVYNPVYISYAEDAVMNIITSKSGIVDELKTEGLKPVIQSLRVKYLSPTLWGDKLEIVTTLDGINGGNLCVNVRMKNIKTQADLAKIAMNWMLYDCEAGEYIPFPPDFGKVMVHIE